MTTITIVLNNTCKMIIAFTAGMVIGMTLMNISDVRAFKKKINEANKEI